MLVHNGMEHLLLNLVLQILMGCALGYLHDWLEFSIISLILKNLIHNICLRWRIALVYLAGGAAGSMGISITSPQTYLVGASGGIYALITANIVSIAMNWKKINLRSVQIFLFVSFCSFDIFISFYQYIFEQDDRVSYISHFCGAMAGLLVGIFVLRNVNSRPWQEHSWVWWIALTLYALLMVFGIAGHVLFPNQLMIKHLKVAGGYYL